MLLTEQCCTHQLAIFIMKYYNYTIYIFSLTREKDSRTLNRSQNILIHKYKLYEYIILEETLQFPHFLWSTVTLLLNGVHLSKYFINFYSS